MKKEEKKIAILGAGPTGLGAAYNLSRQGHSVLVIDRAHYVGGASASFKIKDYIVDYGPHTFHVKKEDIVKMVTDLIKNSYNKVKRNSRLILDGKNLHYPLDIKEALLKINPALSIKILLNYLSVRLKSYILKNNQVRTFQDWGVGAFGNTLYCLAFGNYSEKMWGIPGSKLSSKLAQQKLLKLNLLKIILKVLGIGDPTFEGGVMEYYDLYPHFGIGTVFERMQEEILKDKKNEIHLDSKIININIKGNKLENICFESNGQRRTRDFDYLISTIPLKYLSEYLSIPEKNRLDDMAQKLTYRDIRIIYVVLDKDFFSNIHWVYLLDPHFRFNRLSEQKNLNKESSPPGKTVISLDISCNYGDKIWKMTDDDFFKLALDDLGHLGISKSHITDCFSLKLRDVYPVYDLNFDIRLQGILKIIEQYSNLYSTGRQGLFLNNDIHDSIEMGKLCSEFIMDEKSSQDWYEFIGEYIRKSLEGE